MKRIYFFRTLLVSLLIISSLFFSEESFAQSKRSEQRTIKGSVLIDEHGFQGAVLTDGFSVVKTNRKGEFKISPHERARFITLTTPDGYKHTSSFYIPVDSQEFIFTVEPAGESSGHFVHYSDPEEYGYRDWIDRLREYIETNEPEFIVMSGDICYERGLKMHANEVTEDRMGCRLVYTLGNHDLLKGYTDPLGNDHGEQLFETLFGPVWYSFNVGGVHFVVLPMLFGDAKPSFSSADVYKWLEKDLEMMPKGMPVVMFAHTIPVNNDRFEFKADGVELDLKKYNLKGAFHGHYHLNSHYRTPEGVDIFCSNPPNKGGKDHTSSSFRRVWFNEAGNLESELIYNILDKHVVFNPFYSGDNVKVVATIYDSSSDALFVDASVGEEDVEFEKVDNNAFTWSATIDRKTFEAEEKVEVLTYFSDGEIVKNTIHLPEFYVNPVSPVRPEWVAAIPAPTAFAAPIVTDNLLLIAGIDDDKSEQCGVYALDKRTGDFVWFFPSEASIKNRMIYENGTLYFCDVLMNLYALDVAEFNLLWKRSYKGEKLQYIYSEGIAYDSGMIFLGRGDEFRAVDALTGEEIWRNSHWSGGVSGVVENIVTEGVVVTASYWKGRYGHDVKDGALLWSKTDTHNRYGDSSPVLMDDANLIWLNQTSIEIIDPKTGETIKSANPPLRFASRSKPLVTENMIFVGTSDDGIVAYDRETLEQRWNYKTQPALIYTVPYSKDFQMTVESSPILYGEFVIVAANDGYLYALDAATGQYRWRYNIGLPVVSDLVTDGESIWLVDLGGKIFKLGTQIGDGGF